MKNINGIKLKVEDLLENKFESLLFSCGKVYKLPNDIFIHLSLQNWGNGDFILVETAENSRDARNGIFEDSDMFYSDSNAESIYNEILDYIN